MKTPGNTPVAAGTRKARPTKNDGSRLMLLKVVPGLRGGLVVRCTPKRILLMVSVGYNRKMWKAAARDGYGHPLLLLKAVFTAVAGKEAS